MEQSRYINIALDIFCIILSILPIVYLINSRKNGKKINAFFSGLCISTSAMMVANLLCQIYSGTSDITQTVISMIAIIIYYITSICVIYFFMRYVLEYLTPKTASGGGYVRKIGLFWIVALFTVQIIIYVIRAFIDLKFYSIEFRYSGSFLSLTSQIIPVLCCVFCGILAIICRNELQNQHKGIFSFLYIVVPLLSYVIQIMMPEIEVANAGAVFTLLIILMNIQFDYEIKIRQQDKELTDQRIDIMLSQIQPHFIYNSLGVIYHLCESDPKTARKAVRKFSDFLRGNMESLNAHGPIVFEKELNHAANYLYLEQQRFGDKLQVIFSIKTENFLIPPLTVQPLVENAVQHGILNKKDGGTIIIRTEETDEYAVVIISDNGIGMEKAKEHPSLGNHAHIGIANVRNRLKEMVDGKLEIESSNCGTTVTILIPWAGRGDDI